MTYEVVENFAAGLDTRKSPLAAPAGTLTRLTNAMISPGGEIAKRRAFVEVADVTGSFGLAATGSTLYVFGRDVDPVLPSWPITGVTLAGQKIPNADLTLVQTDYDVFDGKIYLACAIGWNPADPLDLLPTEPTPAENPHYFDAILTEGAGKGYYVRTYQTKMYAVINKLLWFSAVGNPAVWEAEDYIGKITVTKLTHANPAVVTVDVTDISKFSNGQRVLIEGATATGMAAANGFKTISSVNSPVNTFKLDGANTSTATKDMTAGVTATPAIKILTISNTNPAVATVATADIGKFTNGMTVNIDGPTGVGLVNAAGKHTISSVNTPVDTFTLDGVNAVAASAPGGPYWTTITTDVSRTGRGYINLSTQDADSEQLTSLEVYYNKLAVFSTEATQIWAVDPDELKNQFEQLLRGSGSTAPRSALQYGSGDVLYLDPSGIRSLKAKDSSNSASVSDIGSPVDPTVRSILLDPDKGQHYLNKSIALLEPSIGRFWMVLPNEILCLSYFPGPEITAWSVLTVPFTIQYAVTCGGRIFFRSTDDKIWVYGGVDGKAYDDCGVEVRLPYLNGKKPGHNKMFEAVDLTVSGTWELRVSYDFNNPDAEEVVGTFSASTWNLGKMELQGYSSHISLRLYNSDSADARLSNLGVHYNIADDEQ